ncbi:RHS repeat-associated core domain-containing protein [Microbacterium sp.]|uniref:RHS repeat-associated core domain-containing protein n=1 Tax=Microbacterium sp. TaxID=51671 RepID=UPI0025E6FAC9|nr:RHS repeat-associated core domain-containing protein [Microbacterium sp.]
MGGNERSTNSLGGLTLMGARLYDNTTGRFLTVDPVYGGNANPYTYPTDPINDADLTGKSKGGNQSQPKKLSEAEKHALAHPSTTDPKTLRSARQKEIFNEKLAGKRNAQKRKSNFAVWNPWTERVIGRMMAVIGGMVIAVLLVIGGIGGSIFEVAIG